MTKVEMKEIVAWDPPLGQVESWLLDAGNTIGSVWFNKRSDGKLRKMAYRLHVKNPSAASKPKGFQDKIVMQCTVCGATKESGRCGGPFVKVNIKTTNKRQQIDKDNNQVTVLAANKVVRDKDGNITGRGAYRCVPLNLVTRIKNKGTTYVIKHND